MSKITFRADEDLIDRVERLDASKSEVMREALRAYLVDDETTRGERGRGRSEDRGPVGGDGRTGDGDRRSDPTIDEFVAHRVDAVLEERLATGGRDIDLTISLEGVQAPVDGTDGSTTSPADEADAEHPDAPLDERATTCGQCGTDLDPDHVHCPNCGEKATRRVFCDCGDELRSDWAFCPSCGRRTPAADVLDSG